MDWQTFIISVLGSGVVAALVTALVNGLMNHRTQIVAIKESGLYTKRADVLDESMKKMERLDRYVDELISPFQFDPSMEAERNRRKNTGEAFNEFMELYKNSRHYLPKKLSDELGNLLEEYRDLFKEFTYEARPEDGETDTKKWRELVKKHGSEFTAKKDAVAEEFRKIIGVK